VLKHPKASVTEPARDVNPGKAQEVVTNAGADAVSAPSVAKEESHALSEVTNRTTKPVALSPLRTTEATTQVPALQGTNEVLVLRGMNSMIAQINLLNLLNQGKSPQVALLQTRAQRVKSPEEMRGAMEEEKEVQDAERDRTGVREMIEEIEETEGSEPHALRPMIGQPPMPARISTHRTLATQPNSKRINTPKGRPT